MSAPNTTWLSPCNIFDKHNQALFMPIRGFAVPNAGDVVGELSEETEAELENESIAPGTSPWDFENLAVNIVEITNRCGCKRLISIGTVLARRLHNNCW